MENIKYIPGDWIRIQSIVNWFAKDKDAPLKVVECDCDAKKTVGTLRVVERNYDKKSYLIYESDVIPIPITLEILEKNGWKKDDDFKAYVKRVGVTFIFLSKLSNGDWNVCLCESRLITCKYVHQLQHLLFGLGLDNNLII